MVTILENTQAIQFLKNKIKDRLTEVKDQMGYSYKIHMALVDSCNNIEKLKEMAELDLQMDQFKYIKDEIESRLNSLGLDISNIQKLESVYSDITPTVTSSINTSDIQSSEISVLLDNIDIEMAMVALLDSRADTEAYEEGCQEELIDFNQTDETEDSGDLDGAELYLGIDDMDLNAPNEDNNSLMNYDDLLNQLETDNEGFSDYIGDENSPFNCDVEELGITDQDLIENDDDPFSEINEGDFGVLVDDDFETDEDEADSTEPYDPFSDIDESELESYIDDSEELFNENNQVKPSTINTASAQTQKRSQPKKLSRQEKLTSENVFLDGTERGTKSQKMFNHFSKVAQFASYFVGKEIGA